MISNADQGIPQLLSRSSQGFLWTALRSYLPWIALAVSLLATFVAWRLAIPPNAKSGSINLLAVVFDGLLAGVGLFFVSWFAVAENLRHQFRQNLSIRALQQSDERYRSVVDIEVISLQELASELAAA